MDSNQIYKEFLKYRNEIVSLGAGVSVVERGLTPPGDRRRIEENEARLGKENIKALTIKVLARYIVLCQENPDFFDFVAENHLHRALFNNGIKDSDLDYWCMSPREYSQTDRQVPSTLQSEINSVRNQ